MYNALICLFHHAANSHTTVTVVPAARHPANYQHPALFTQVIVPSNGMPTGTTATLPVGYAGNSQSKVYARQLGSIILSEVIPTCTLTSDMYPVYVTQDFACASPLHCL